MRAFPFCATMCLLVFQNYGFSLDWFVHTKLRYAAFIACHVQDVPLKRYVGNFFYLH